MTLFLCALLSKTVTAPWPAAMLLILYWKRAPIPRPDAVNASGLPGEGIFPPHPVLPPASSRRGGASRPPHSPQTTPRTKNPIPQSGLPITRRDLIPLLPFFALALFFGLLTAALERAHVGAWGPEWAFSPLDRLLIAGRAIWFYAATLVVPARLLFIYPRWTLDAAAPVQFIFPAAAVVTLAVLWILRHRLGGGPLVAALFFVGTLVPALGFVNVFPMRYSFVADHFQYHASIGLIALLAAGLTTLLAPIAPRARNALALIVAALAVLTFRQTLIYESPLTLWRATLAGNPDSWMVHVNLAQELLGPYRDRGRPAPPEILDQAESHFRRAVEFAPAVPDTHFSLGMLLADRGDWSAAAIEYQSALDLADAAGRSAFYPDIRNSLGLSLFATGDTDGAIARYHQALAIKSDYPRAWFNLAVAYEKKPDPARALDAYGRALELAPDYAAARYNAANLLRQLGRFDAAIEQYEMLLIQDPARADVHANLAATHFAVGRTADALAHYAAAARLDPALRPAIIRSLAPHHLHLPTDN